MKDIIDYKPLGKRIARRRGYLGLKQAEINEAAELSDKYLSHIETARTIPSLDVLVRICMALDITPDYLLLGSLKKADFLDDYSILLQKIKTIDHPKKMELLDSFVDWLIDQTL